MNLWRLSLGARRLLHFGLSVFLTGVISALFSPRLWTGGMGTLDGSVADLYLLLLFTGVFNLLLYVVGFAFGWRRQTPSAFLCSGTSPLGEVQGESGLSTTLSDRSRLAVSGVSDVATRIAIVMPIYHEDTERVWRGVRATWLSVRRAGLDRGCDFYLLCDSTDEEIRNEEERVYSRLVAEFGGAEVEKTGRREDGKTGTMGAAGSDRHEGKNGNGQSPVADSPWPADAGQALGRFFLIRRKERKHFKAGNIAHFLENHGVYYDFMLVLDADSVMLGETIRRMILRMQASPNLAILQSTVIPFGALTPFARSMQFSLARTLPLFARGLYWFLGRESVYWGHNALIRIEPFMSHANLPIMPGKPPLGGPILSQDIVEAALLGRAGWAVEWDVESDGSFDELPANVLTYGKRDRRWCQGNFQHFWLIFGDRMKLGHRLYFANGIFAYCAGPLLLFLMVLGMTQSLAVSAEAESSVFDGRFVSLLFAMLALPRVLGLVRLLRSDDYCGRAGTMKISARGLRHVTDEVISTILEMLISILTAPLLFYLHTRFVLEILTGGSVAWKNQSRNPAESLLWTDAARMFWLPSLLGVVGIATCLTQVPAALIYVAPILSCWLFSIPLAVVTSSPGLGSLLLKWSLFKDRWSGEERELVGEVNNGEAGVRRLRNELFWRKFCVPHIVPDSSKSRPTNADAVKLHCDQ